jgi:5-methylthioadenosine/S-adenosylhomocysteine deaminase
VVALLPSDQASKAYAAAARVDLPFHVLVPGLINLHTHAAMTLMRGLADDLPLMEWLNQHIWPAEGKHVSPEFVYDGTLLACAEMLCGGVTCFNDMYFYPEQAARAALDAGMRAAIGMICIEFPTSYAADAQDYLRKGLAARDRYRGEPLLSFCLAPHAPYTVSDRSFEQIVTYSGELEVPIHMHLHETQDEIRESLTRFGVRPVERLRRLGLLGPALIAVHAVHLSEEEIDLLAAQGASVAHCPSSNLKLASGVAPLARFVERGLNT